MIKFVNDRILHAAVDLSAPTHVAAIRLDVSGALALVVRGEPLGQDTGRASPAGVLGE